MIYNFLFWIFIFLLVFLLLCVIAVFLVWLRYFFFFVVFHEIAIQFIWFSVGTQVEFIFPHEMANKFQYKNSGEFFHYLFEYSSTLYECFFGLIFSNEINDKWKRHKSKKRAQISMFLMLRLLQLFELKWTLSNCFFCLLVYVLVQCTYTHQMYCACGRISADQRQCI